jgi:hypothetical protein
VALEERRPRPRAQPVACVSSSLFQPATCRTEALIFDETSLPSSLLLIGKNPACATKSSS